MAIQITIVGLGQIGTSMGLALANQTELLRRVGHDHAISTARLAEKMGALDQVELNLPKAVRNADLVILALPVDQIRETLKLIALDLKVNAVVMDTGSIKEIVTNWAGELIPAGRHYIGLTPVINPEYLHGADAGIGAARADLFHGGVMASVTPPRASSEAIQLAADLTRLLGSSPLFIDPVEIDGLMAATHLLPQLMAAALLNATVDQPGWQEGRKVAGRAYAEATGPIVHLGEAQNLATSSLLNRANVLRVLDGTIAALRAIRDDIETQDETSLGERLGRAQEGRERWWVERKGGDWARESTPNIKLPENPGFMGRMFGIGKRLPRDGGKGNEK